MTTPIKNELLNHQQTTLKSETISQKEKIDILSQKELKTKKLTEELAAKYPIMDKRLEITTEQGTATAFSIEHVERSQMEANKIAKQSQDLIAKLDALSLKT